MRWLADLQPLVIAAWLGWSGGFKVLGRTAPLAAASSALRTLLGQRWALPAFRAVGFAELAAAIAVLVPPAWPVPAIGLSTAFLVYLGYARVAAPESSCGCTSARPSPIGWRHFTNAGFLLAISVFTLLGNGSWPGAWSVQAVPVILAEAAVIISLNGQFDRYWLMPLRRLKVRLTHPLAAATTDVIPLHATVQTLERSPAFMTVGQALRSDVIESWDEGEWRLVRYTARFQDRPASAVFAVPRGKDEPDRVKVAVVDDADSSVLFAA
ncbi:MAG TPA: MauE/DoxX family redox-associated membrane protein [Candidatus Limnocylindrales bacterium]|nr:MauE/DoxX family redox-associated membrane protein [Candidatus Limnocylindrales bacterium]